MTKELARNDLEAAAQPGAGKRVWVTRAYADSDIEAAIQPGLTAIVYPGAESQQEIERADTRIKRLERLRGIRPGVIGIEATVRTTAGVLHCAEMAGSSPRLQAITVERPWLAVHLGIDDSDESVALTYALSVCELSARECDLAVRAPSFLLPEPVAESGNAAHRGTGVAAASSRRRSGRRIRHVRRVPIAGPGQLAEMHDTRQIAGKEAQ